MKNMRNKDFILLIGSIIAFVLFVVLVGGCRSFKHAASVMNSQPEKRAAYCNSYYKPIEKTKTVTKYIPGKTIKVAGEPVYIDYNCDSAITAEMDRLGGRTKVKTIRVEVPKYVQVDTQAILIQVDRENAAALTVQGYVIDSLRNALSIEKYISDKAITKAHNRLRAAVWGWSAFISLLLALLAYNWLKSQYARKVNAVKDIIS